MFMRIVIIVVLVFCSGVCATVILLPKIAKPEDDGEGPCRHNSDDTNTSGVGTGADALCNGHGTCPDNHSHCDCTLSMYQGNDCSTLSFGFIAGAPIGIAALLWLAHMGWILRDKRRPPPSADQLDAIYSELQTLFVTQPSSRAQLSAQNETAANANSNITTFGKVTRLPLSRLWCSGLGAVVVLVRRPG